MKVLYFFYSENRGNPLQEINGLFGRIVGGDVVSNMEDGIGDENRVSGVEGEGDVMPVEQRDVLISVN